MFLLPHGLPTTIVSDREPVLEGIIVQVGGCPVANELGGGVNAGMESSPVIVCAFTPSTTVPVVDKVAQVATPCAQPTTAVVGSPTVPRHPCRASSHP
jgi:hypothetical protein